MVLAVLKTTGIVALIVVIIILIIGALVLFSPIKYRVSGDVGKKQFSIRLNWMFHMIRLRGEIEDGILFELRLLFFKLRLYPRDKEKDALKKKRREERKRKKRKKRADRAKRRRERARKKAGLSKRSEQKKDTDEEPEKSRFQKALSIVKKGWKILRESDTPAVLGTLAEQGKYVLYHCRPRRIKADIRFGLTDPSLTGRILGAVSMAAFLFAYDIQLDPVFDTEETALEGKADIAGKARLIWPLIALIRMIRVQEFRSFIKITIKHIRKK